MAISQFTRDDKIRYAIRDERYRYVEWIKKVFMLPQMLISQLFLINSYMVIKKIHGKLSMCPTIHSTKKYKKILPINYINCTTPCNNKNFINYYRLVGFYETAREYFTPGVY